MNEYINLTLDNIDDEHICCAIGDKKHQAGVDRKKEWIKSKLKDGHIFRKLNARGKIFNASCIFNNWANFYKGEFVSNTILNANSFEKLVE